MTTGAGATFGRSNSAHDLGPGEDAEEADNAEVSEVLLGFCTDGVDVDVVVAEEVK